MNMKKKLFLMMAVFLFPISCWAEKTTYIATNHRFNYVKIKEVSGNQAETRRMSHPVKLDEQGLRAALKSLKLARSYLVKKEVETQQIFDDPAVDFLTPNLVKAFEQATNKEEVVFSYVSKQPFFIVKNDRLSICRAFVHDDELHIKFEKLYAKILGDVDKRGGELRAISRAQGLRVKLDIGEGQMMGVSDPEEVVLNLHYNYVKKPEPEKPPEPVTMAGEKIRDDDISKPDPAAPKEVASKSGGKVTDDTISKPNPDESVVKTPQERLQQIDQLKKDGLISKREYEEKRKEILQGL